MIGIHAALEGTLGADPNLRMTHSEKPVLTLRIAVNDSSRHSDGDGDGDTTWVRATVWEDEALRLQPLLRKGQRVYVEGRLRLEQWQGPDGQPRSGLAVSAWRVEILGQIGRSAPKRSREDAA
jgi:single-strand DNA-binding protein